MAEWKIMITSSLLCLMALPYGVSLWLLGGTRYVAWGELALIPFDGLAFLLLLIVMSYRRAGKGVR
jgi:hypothetical protein